MNSLTDATARLCIAKDTTGAGSLPPLSHATDQTSFNTLSLELRQMIYKWAATDNTDKIHVEPVNDDGSSLDTPAITVLLKLKDVSPALYQEAVTYLCGRNFRWVFVSNAQPHRCQLRVFRAQVPKEVPESILQAEISRMTIRGLVDPLYMQPGARASLSLDEWSRFLIQIKRDVQVSLTLFSLIFPATTPSPTRHSGLSLWNVNAKQSACKRRSVYAGG
jgi:hypothetical protein